MIIQRQGVLSGVIHRISTNKGEKMERLQKTIAKAGIASRRKAEELIVSGKVKVNGVVVTELGTQVSPDDDISVNGVVLKKEEKVYYLLNKPRRVISSVSDEKGRETVLAYLSDVKERIYPVGRLDYDTSGILLLTNDGQLSHNLLSPNKHVDKKYYVELKTEITAEMIEKLENGIKLEENFITKNAKIEVMKDEKNIEKDLKKVFITITEGKFHQVKRMFTDWIFKIR